MNKEILKSHIRMTFLLLTVFITLPSCQTEIHQNITTGIPSADIPEKVDKPTPTERNRYGEDRNRMVEHQLLGRGVIDESVLNAMRTVPRHEFVLKRYLSFAYDDTPLPINQGQTISQPYIVGLMTELLNVVPGDKVLEIGTGSGYQAAILAEMGMNVYSVEIIPALAEEAKERLQRLGLHKIHLLTADGYYGWEENAPYDAIIVTAAPDHLPQSLTSQLKEGGRLVIPIGPVGAVQTLWLFEKIGGEIQATNMGSVSFVPLTGDH
jgi:protein-L-isoaspartate(D-aspartate) O-methyltransferase